VISIVKNRFVSAVPFNVMNVRRKTGWRKSHLFSLLPVVSSAFCTILNFAQCVYKHHILQTRE